MVDLKKAWTQTGKSFVLAINDLGISLAATARAGIESAVEWARKDNPHVQAEGEEIAAEEPVEAAEPVKTAETVEAVDPVEAVEAVKSVEEAAEEAAEKGTK